MSGISVVISQTSQRPIYRQIEEQITAQIVAGSLPEGGELPSIRELARDLRVSVITVKRAYDELEADGFLSTVPGKGCYVSIRNRELFREQRLRLIEAKLDEAVAEAKRIGATRDELVTMLTILFPEGGDGARLED